MNTGNQCEGKQKNSTMRARPCIALCAYAPRFLYVHAPSRRVMRAAPCPQDVPGGEAGRVAGYSCGRYGLEPDGQVRAKAIGAGACSSRLLTL